MRFAVEVALKKIWILFSILLLTMAQGAYSEESAVLDLVAQGRYDEARKQLEESSNHPVDRLILEAEIAADQGSIKKAIRLYRELVAAYPEVWVFHERLMQLLLLDRARVSAAKELDWLSKRHPERVMRRVYLEMNRQLQAREAPKVAFYFDFEPSRNVNDASSESVIDFLPIPDEFMPKAGVKATYGVKSSSKITLLDRQELIASINFGRNQYTVDTLDQSFAEGNFEWVYQDRNKRFSFQPFWGRVWGDGEVYATKYLYVDQEIKAEALRIYRDEDFSYWGLRLSGEYWLDQRQFVFGEASMTKKTYDSQKYFGYADSLHQHLKLGVGKVFKDQFQLSAWHEWQFHTEEGANNNGRSQNNYNGQGFGLSFIYQAQNGFRLETSILRTNRHYDLPHSLTFGKTIREDSETGFQLSLSHQQIQFLNFVPHFDCSYMRIKSNIVDFERKKSGCGISFSYLY